MQSKLIAGDSLRFSSSVPDYPASDGYTLTYKLVRRDAAGGPITIVAAADGDGYLVTVLPATTASWTPGKYTWAAYVTKTGERYTVETGEVEILPDPAVSGAPLDMRSQARKALDDLNAARATWVATGGRVKRYSIAGRDIEYKDAAEIDMEINYWTKQVGEEQTSADLEAGRRPKNRILTRFVRPS
jgi:hypothetical protein